MLAISFCLDTSFLACVENASKNQGRSSSRAKGALDGGVATELGEAERSVKRAHTEGTLVMRTLSRQTVRYYSRLSVSGGISAVAFFFVRGEASFLTVRCLFLS